jgi:hypothetical protein
MYQKHLLEVFFINSKKDMKQKKIGFTALLLICTGITLLHAQQSANAAGGDATGSAGSASFSVGQVAYTYVAGSNAFSNQGVQQPYEFFTVGINNYPAITLSLSVFPNPTPNIINLKVESGDFENLALTLYDINGKAIISQKVNSALTQVAMQSLAAGSYLLRVNDMEKELKTFKIIKNN